MSQKRYSLGSYSILINGKIAFTVWAVSEVGAVIIAAVNNRYRQILRERQGECLILTARRIRDM